ncbi:MAG: chorismate mutase [Lachnospiraceae bacterium]|nr:chorismate mutase [Lachnospiraceae bacterium]MBR5766144.1 chorismate mutase [Lachnospiraceae bacterium]MBR6486926.1 chorismate mutase [Lachnospiraceae bacterium]
MDKLTEARHKIEDIDKEMAKLFIKRMECSEMIAEYKSANGIPILDTGRENELIKRNEEYIENERLKPFYNDFMKSVLNISKQYQHKLMEDMRI